MTMTVEDRVKLALGDLLIQIAALQTEIEALREKVALLEAEAKGDA